MRNHLQTLSFRYYNKIGLNSFPNGIPLITGQMVEPVRRGVSGFPDIAKELDCGKFMDDSNHIFKAFKKNGYKSLYVENYLYGGTPWADGCHDFSYIPTDHIMNPYFTLLETYRWFEKLFNETKEECENRFTPILSYWEQFLDAYSGMPRFTFIWESVINHDGNNTNGYLTSDSDMKKFLQKHSEKIDKSFFFLVGDHGYRFGEVAQTKTGSLENNNPLFTISLPRELRSNNRLINQIKKNAMELQTVWDLRATIFDILENQSNGFSVPFPDFFEKGRGSSMLRPQPGPRDCLTLPIPSEYCICESPVNMTNITTNMNTNYAKSLGHVVIDEINQLIRNSGNSDRCRKWELSKVRSIVSRPSNGGIELIVETKGPTDAVFKTTLFEIQWSYLAYDISAPERLDMYGKKGDCAPSIKILCDCL